MRDELPLAKDLGYISESVYGDLRPRYDRVIQTLSRLSAYSDEIATDCEANRHALRRKSAVRDVGAKRRWEFVHSLSVV